MERVFKLGLPLLLLVNIALWWNGALEGGAALMVGGAIEALLLLVASRQVLVVVRRYRRDRASGLDVEAALEDGLALLLPRQVARLVALEPRLWICLYRWLFKRRPLGPEEFSYNRRSMVGTLALVVLFTSPVELLLAELLVPWPFLRWTILILGIYGAIWLLGFAASMRMLPYRLDATGLRARYGLLADGFIPYTHISEVVLERRASAKQREGFSEAPREGAAYVSVGGRTDVVMRLCEPATFQKLLSASRPVTTVYLAVDEPGKLAQELRRRADLLPAA